jgi:hypothetical protein
LVSAFVGALAGARRFKSDAVELSADVVRGVPGFVAIFINVVKRPNILVSKRLNTQKYAVSMPELWKNSETLMSEIPALLKAAENTSYEGRTFSYARGGPGGVLAFREASEKAWIVLFQVTDIMVEHLLHKVPKGSYERRLALRDIEGKWPEAASKRFYDRYAALMSYLRNNQVYLTTLDLEMLRYEVGRLNVYVADVKGVISK